MKDNKKTQAQLIEELTKLRQRIAELEKKDTERKQGEAKLARLIRQNELILSSAAEGILGLDLQGNHTFVNPAAARMLGYEVEELLGRHSHGTWHHTKPDGSPYPKEECAIYAAYRDGVVHRASTELFWRKDGTSFPVEYASTPIYEQGRLAGAVVTFADITERKQAEEALRKSEEKYRSIIENIQEGYFENDLAGNFTFVNDALCRILGYPKEELIGKNNRQYTDEKTAKKIYQVYNRIYRTGESSKGVEEEYIRKDGSKFVAELSVSLISEAEGKPIGFRGIARDVTERRQAEAALRESETRFRTLFDAIPDTVLVHDDEGTILHINEIGAQQLEWSAKDLVGRNLREIVTSESRALIADHIKETHNDGWCRFETTYVSRSGWKIIAEVNDRLIKLGKEKAILRVARDITERKAAEQALVREKNFSDAIINSSPGLLFVFGEGGNITQWNSNAENVTGYSASEIAKMNIIDFVAEEDTKTVAEAAQEALTKGQASVEINILSKPGNKIPFYITGRRTKIENATCVVCSGMDIIQRKQAEEALRESEQRYRGLFERTAEGILIADLKSKRFLHANPSICSMLGYSEEEFRNMSVRDIHPSESLDHVISEFEAQARGEKSLAPAIPCLRKDRTIVYADIVTSKMLIDNYECNVGFFTDTTERKQAEEEIKRGYEQLRKTFHETISALASTVEMRDRYTAGHQPRVTQLACAIAGEMGLSAGQIEGIRMAASIHDIGKIMVPAEILSKPGPLTELQFEMIKMHPQAGYDILKGIRFPWPVAEIVLQHHERLDGSGYPRGFKDGEIMLEARTLIVANVVEAMTAHRPYRPAVDIQEALAEISKSRGILYDPAAVDACIKLFTKKAFRFSEAPETPRSQQTIE
jgi:PAS domain S-box-containing protein